MSKMHEAKMPSLKDQIEAQAIEEEKSVKRKFFRKRKRVKMGKVVESPKDKKDKKKKDVKKK